MEYPGFFITFEGPEGGGKSTQIRHLQHSLAAQGFDVLLTREPGGTPISQSIRSILLDQSNTAMSPRAETLLFNAARAQLVDEVIRPALEEGKVVLCDRYADSTTAYQGHGRGQSFEDLHALWHFATQSLSPDLTILFDLDPIKGLKRKQDGDEAEWNRMEAEALAFHETVRRGFLRLAADEPERWFIIDAAETIEALRKQILDETVGRLKSVVTAQ